MTAGHRKDPEWREFERLVARIEADASSQGVIVSSPDRIKCKTTGRLREVDASIRSQSGTVEILVTIECRRRANIQDVTWIEQLATKKRAIGADHTIAVSTSGFSKNAQKVAADYGISLRKISEVGIEEINSLLQLDFVVFWHKACAISRVGIRKFRSLDWKVPNPSDIDFELPKDTDPFEPIFHNDETGSTWSLNDLWHQTQEATDPFEGIEKAQPPIERTACFPYPGTVTLTTGNESIQLGDVMLTFGLWIEPETVALDAADKVEYSSEDVPTLQRVEFVSRRRKDKDLRISLQIAKHSDNTDDLRTRGTWSGEDE